MIELPELDDGYEWRLGFTDDISRGYYSIVALIIRRVPVREKRTRSRDRDLDRDNTYEQTVGRGHRNIKDGDASISPDDLVTLTVECAIKDAYRAYLVAQAYTRVTASLREYTSEAKVGTGSDPAFDAFTGPGP